MQKFSARQAVGSLRSQSGGAFMADEVRGPDFGTSNSTLALHRNGQASLCPLEGDASTLPSAVFFDFEEHQVRFP